MSSTRTNHPTGHTTGNTTGQTAGHSPSDGGPRGRGRGRAPRGTLNPEVIVTAAIAVIDADGLDALTTRRLADTLGVQPMSLYTHFRDKNAILQAVAAELSGRLQLPEGAPSDIDLLRRIMTAYFRLLVDHPVLLQLDTLVSNTPLDDQVGEAIHGCLQRLQLPLRSAVGHAATLSRFVIGSATVYPGRRRAWDEDPGYWERLRQRLSALPPETYPSMRALTRDFPAFTQEEAFEFGLETLLTAVETAAAASSPADQ
jgi:AcrR family transcriptional regulator